MLFRSGTDGYIYTNIELRSDRTGETLSRGNLYTKIYALRHTPSLIKNILNSYDNSIINVITEIDKADANTVKIIMMMVLLSIIIVKFGIKILIVKTLITKTL